MTNTLGSSLKQKHIHEDNVQFVHLFTQNNQITETTEFKSVVVLRFAKLCAIEGKAFVDFDIYFELVYLVTALVPSDTACFASSPGSNSRTAV